MSWCLPTWARRTALAPIAGPHWGLYRDPIRLAPVPDASRPDRRRADDRRRRPGADRTGPCSPLQHDRRHLRRTSRLLGGHHHLPAADGPLQVFPDFLLLLV